MRVARTPAKRQSDASLARTLKAAWASRYPVFLFVVAFGLLMVLYYAFSFTPFFINRFYPFIIECNAAAASSILNLFGQHTINAGDTISSSKLTLSLRRGCDAVEPAAFLVAAILVFPSKFLPKIPGIIVGTALLMVLNLIRVVSLFLVGVYYPSAFEILHVEIWQVVFVLLALLFWALWISQALPSQAQRAHASR